MLGEYGSTRGNIMIDLQYKMRSTQENLLTIVGIMHIAN
jgi:hypothetical protein